MAPMQTRVPEVRSGSQWLPRACALAALIVGVAAATSSGCGGAAGGNNGGTDAGTDAGTDGGGDAGSTFHVDISITTGLITFPNKYSGWSVGGGSATNFVAYPSGWSVGGGSATNFIAVPPGWSVGGGSATNFVGYPSGQGWTVGGGSATNFTALPPGWSAGGGSATNFVAVAPGWVVGGGSATNFVAYPGPTVTTIQIKFDDPGWLGLLKAAQDSGSYAEQAVADMAMYAFLNLRAEGSQPMEASAGTW